ncbi:F-box/LRR-repeat protein 10 isoform X1 [Syzygium oleosum]|uniref:F-box/LRR-repeat protein 10 isoform X1 n=1 Tax=Syzygium oleosum TaxID=219896 RepID=UPI0011D2469B|nr:F-box/LRR-repeat protein 10 isoform X1 [Syzygium oleosum]
MEEEEEKEASMVGLDQLPSALLATIMMKLDVSSICSAGSTCKTFRHCASHVLSFIPSIHLLEIAPSIELLRPLLPPNPLMRSLKVDCDRLNDSAIRLLARPSLHELHLHNCGDFSGKLLSEIGSQCGDLKFLYLGSVAENRGRALHVSDLEELLSGCTQLEALFLMFDVSIFIRHNFARVWALASTKLTSLEIGYISSVMITELLNPNLEQTHIQPSVLPKIQKLSLSVDYITDAMVGTIFRGLLSLTHLDLRDAPIIEPRLTFDLTNSGLQQINQNGKLRHLSLVRSQEYLVTYFKRVNDLGILLMADRCANMESIYLGGFCRVTDTGFREILHSCSSLYKLRVAHGTLLTNLLFHDIRATSLSLTHVSLRWCNLMTNLGVKNLVSNVDLRVLDLRDCKSLGDEALRAIGTLSKLKILQLDGSDITDMGLSYLRWRVITSLTSLSLRGCKRLTDKGISLLFEGSSKYELQELDLSNIPSISDDGILSLARARLPILELRLRQCPLIGDTSIMALASMQAREEGWQGSRLRLLDLHNCGGITQLSFRWLKRPYFPRLRWLGLTGSVNRDMVDALARSRPFLHVACHGEELGADPSNRLDDSYMREYDDIDEFEQWLLGGEDSGDDDDDNDDVDDEDVAMEVAESDAEMEQ